MRPEQLLYILKETPEYYEMRIYLKGRQQMVYSKDKSLFKLELRNDLLIIIHDTDGASLERGYTQFIDVNEIQSINFLS